MAAHRKLDLRRVYLCAVGLHKRAALLSYTFKLSSTREGGASHCDRLTIILSLLCGELKRQNPPREALARSLGHVGNILDVDSTGRGLKNHHRKGIQRRHRHPSRT